MIDYNNQKIEAEQYYNNFKKEIDYKILTKYKDRNFSKVEPMFILSIQEFLDAINDFFFSQYMSSTLMCRNVLESSIQLSIFWYYQNKLFSDIGEEGLNGFSLIVKEMKYFFENISNFDKICGIAKEKLHIISEDQKNELKRLRELSNFVAHRVERIINGPSRINEYNKDMKGINQKINDFVEMALKGNIRSIESARGMINGIKMEIQSEEAKQVLDSTKRYLIEIIANSVQYL